MKKSILIVMAIYLAGCSGKVDNQESDEDILKQISEYKSQVSELNKKIGELEEQLSTSNENNAGVSVATENIIYQPFNHYIEVTGTVEAINSAFISPEISGQVKDIYAKEGEQVKKGELLVKLNSAVTKNSIREVETGLDLAKTVYKKQKELWDKKIGSEIDYLKAKNNKESLENKLATLQAQLDMSEIRAPIDGIIDDISIKIGEMAIPGVRIIRLINLDDLYINADVSESYITSVKEGEKVLLKFPSFPDISMEVPVYRIGNVIKEANRTFKLQLKIKNRNGQIKPNLLAKIMINDFSVDQAVIVPSIIIKQDMRGSYVYKVEPETRTAKKIYVEPGRSYLAETMVKSGLEEGDEVIVKGYNQVSDGTKVQIAN